MPTEIAARELRSLLPTHATVYVQAGVSQPTVLLDALVGDDASRRTYVTAFFPGINEYCLETLGPRTSATVFYAAPAQHSGLRSGHTRYVPLHQSEIGSYLLEQARPEVLLVQVSPPDAAGYCSLGVGADFVTLLEAQATTIVAEVNAQMPRVPDAPSLHWSKLRFVCRSDRPLPAFAEPAADATGLQVARNAAGLIDDGVCLQAGIGTLPAALLTLLGDRRHLGVHSGIIGDGLARLITSGAVTGERKPSGHPAAVTAFIAGTGETYRLATEGMLAVRPPTFTHDVAVIGSIDRFISLGAALEVDLFGQVNAESIDGRAVSGAGGFVDFVRGARRSRGGRSIVMLASTNRERTVNRIVPALAAGTPVTCTRTDVDTIVTEHGVAHLRHLSVEDRALALIGIADPAFRGTLAAEWEALQRR